MDVHTEPLRTALLAGVRAPSPHNTQPWVFEVGADRVDVLLDRDRVLRAADPDGHEARLSCGAAVFNIRLSLMAAGRAAVVRLLPDPARPEVVASVRVAGARAVTPADQRLAAVIARRHTNRRPFLDTPVPDYAKAELMRAAQTENAALRLVERPAEVDALAALIRRGEHLQAQDPVYQAELRRWVHGIAERGDGVRLSAIGPAPEDASLIVLRQFAEEHTPARPFEQQPLLAVLTTPGDHPMDQVQAGQAMQRVLLTATELGLCTSFLSQPIEIPALRSALRGLLGAGRPHTVLRLGYGYAGVPAPRRALTEVVRPMPADELVGGA
ncbi:Acg family FMN-binding oxidoreductase [Actinokineospora sp. HUAS TT18]|uniref:Acg family FMN-binding oxidoreductase n=1 Tax=Actinokineospora sp. HUAS TT18 TaxID=3447451 RepID=UPI003F51D7B8